MQRLFICSVLTILLLSVPSAAQRPARRPATKPRPVTPDRISVIQGTLEIRVNKTGSRTLAPDVDVKIKIAEGSFTDENWIGLVNPLPEVVGCRVTIQGTPALIASISPKVISIIVPHLGGLARYGQLVSVSVSTPKGEWQDWAGYERPVSGLTKEEQ